MLVEHAEVDFQPFIPAPILLQKPEQFLREQQFALGAAHQAMVQAQLEGKVPAPNRVGVILGSGIGGMQTYEDNCTAYVLKGPDRVSPFFVPMFIANMAPGLVSMRSRTRPKSRSWLSGLVR